MSAEQTIKTTSPRWNSAFSKGVAVMLVLLLAGVVFWVVRDRQAGPVVLSFEGYKWEKSSSGGGYWLGKFNVKNNSPEAISFYGMDKKHPPVSIMKANSDVFLNLTVGCGLAADWYSLLPGEEVQVEEIVGDVRMLWQGEFKYVAGEIALQQVWNMNKASKQAISGDKIQESDWTPVRSTTVWPLKMGPFTLARK